MRAVFIGAVQFSKHMLIALIKSGIDIVSVVTKAKSDFNADFCDLSEIAIKNGIEYKYVININHEKNVSYIREKEPDIIFCLGWSQLLSDEILSIPRLGVIGYHPSLLPYNRGRHPIIWALVLGLSKTGSTFLKLNSNADEGDIISQEVVRIDYADTAQTLYEKLEMVAEKQLTEIIGYLSSGHSIPTKKQNVVEGNVWRKRTKEDGKIDWRMSSYSIYNLVRALDKPYPGAYTVIRGTETKIWKVEEIKNNKKNIEPGKVLDILFDGSVIIKAGSNAIKVIDPRLGDYLAKGDYL